MQETLVIVHLSSIDGCLTYHGVDATIELITAMKLAIVTHDGPVLVMDQEWNEITEDAKMLRSSVYELQQFREIERFHHDEMMDVSPWQDGMKRLAKRLRELQSSRIRLAGFWTSDTATTGCVHEVQRQLRAKNIPCYIDKRICAVE